VNDEHLSDGQYATAPNRAVDAVNSQRFLYREVGAGEIPLLLFQHFRGNLDNWDPALIDELAAFRRIVTFDNVGVGGTSGVTPATIRQMARDALTFVDAMKLTRVNLLGFSIGSFVAQEIALVRPDIVDHIVLASSAPRGASGMHGWSPGVIDAVGQHEANPDGYLSVFYRTTPDSMKAGKESLGRIFARKEHRDVPVAWETRLAQYDAVCDWGIPDHSALERIQAINQPVFVAAGDSDPMILPRYSYLLAGLLNHAQLKIYPNAAHGFLFQHHTEFAADVQAFLAD
jgi:pimeloyl-ACP methyl ester carboxylesterase